ncbi:GNAT family protein [Actinocrinis sp.]|uniref:GNAT family N-acetyltransferase n=1 Tax=Actinocrinis sp. TaxID=1920516 RepID=UPI0032C23A10
MEPVTLTTERLTLRPFAAGDVDAVYQACQDREIQFFTPAPSPFGRVDAERFVAKNAQDWAADRNYELGAFRRDGGDLVGSYCLTFLMAGVYELGYWAAREQRGHGFSFEAARALCEWGWATLVVHRLEWWAMTGNTASKALAEKLGFQLEGTLRRRGVESGEPRDWWVGGLLRP